jgi:signal transduction histidine kinase/ActR/RegA family two-component response regulator
MNAIPLARKNRLSKTTIDRSPADHAGPMNLNWFNLKFTGSSAFMEKPYLEQSLLRNLPQVRIALAAAALMYGIFGILDALVIPEAKHITWLIRFAFVIPLLLALLAATFHPRLRKHLQAFLSFGFVSSGLGIIVMIISTPSPVNYYYYVGLILIFIFGYSFSNLRFVLASCSGWFIVILYEVAALYTAMPHLELFSNSFFLVSANIAGMLACYNIEYASRRNYFLMQQLLQEQQKIRDLNNLLERRVAERTEKLEEANRYLKREAAERQAAEKEQERLEVQLKQAEKMEAVGKLAAGVAHDLNNILIGLVTYPAFLLRELPGDSTLRKPIQTIQQSGMKAAAIVQDLLTLSQRGTTDRKVFNLNSIIADHLLSPEHARLQSVHNRVHLEVDLQEDLLNTCGSPVHLMKAVMNLLTNAFEANLVGGTVKISTRNGYVDRSLDVFERIAEGEYAILRVADTGIGIESNDLKQIFEPFFTKKKLGKSGTGLGMTLIWSTVKDHGGFVDVQSATGMGTVFDLYFPATRLEISEKEGPATIEDCLGTENVLIVDDIPEQREIAAIILQKLGYTVSSVAGGEEAVAYLQQRKADILVLDMIMEPGINGYETYRRIAMDHPGQKTIIVSGFSESELVRKAQELGAGEYIRKPYTLEKIARALRSELDRQPAGQPEKGGCKPIDSQLQKAPCPE